MPANCDESVRRDIKLFFFLISEHLAQTDEQRARAINSFKVFSGGLRKENEIYFEH